MTTLTRAAPSRANQTYVMVLLAVSFALLAAAVGLVALTTGYFTSADLGAIPGKTAVKRIALPGATLPPELAPQATTPSDPTQIRQLDHSDALVWNTANPISAQPMAWAAPFHLDVSDTADWDRAVDCLTATVYYESAIEPLEGQRAVAQVVLNRVRHPAYPHTVCGVVFQGSERKTGCQFTFSCDGALRRTPNAALWGRARSVAVAAIAGYVYRPVGLATHYHTNWIVPYWATSLVKLANVGTHIFYRWDGGWGAPRAFSILYRGAEPAVAWRGGFGQTGEALAAIAGTPIPTDDAIPAPALPTERPLLGMGSPNAATADPAKPAPTPGTDVGGGQRWILRDTPAPTTAETKATPVLPAGS